MNIRVCLMLPSLHSHETPSFPVSYLMPTVGQGGRLAEVVGKGRLGEARASAQHEGKGVRSQETALRVCSWTEVPVCASVDAVSRRDQKR